MASTAHPAALSTALWRPISSVRKSCCPDLCKRAAACVPRWPGRLVPLPASPLRPAGSPGRWSILQGWDLRDVSRHSRKDRRCGRREDAVQERRPWCYGFPVDAHCPGSYFHACNIISGRNEPPAPFRCPTAQYRSSPGCMPRLPVPRRRGRALFSILSAFCLLPPMPFRRLSGGSSCGQYCLGQLGNNLDSVSCFYRSSGNHFAEDTQPGHYAVPGCFIYGAPGMALLTYLGYAEAALFRCEHVSENQYFEVDPFRHRVFSVEKRGNDFLHPLDLGSVKKAYLAVGETGVPVTFKPLSGDQQSLSNVFFCMPFCGAVQTAMMIPLGVMALNSASGIRSRTPRRSANLDGSSSISIYSVTECEPPPMAPSPSTMGTPIAAVKFPSEPPPFPASVRPLPPGVRLLPREHRISLGFRSGIHGGLVRKKSASTDIPGVAGLALSSAIFAAIRSFSSGS